MFYLFVMLVIIFVMLNLFSITILVHLFLKQATCYIRMSFYVLINKQDAI